LSFGFYFYFKKFYQVCPISTDGRLNNVNGWQQSNPDQTELKSSKEEKRHEQLQQQTG
jgi:hypothetical protein